jgi:hypothetical protein
VVLGSAAWPRGVSASSVCRAGPRWVAGSPVAACRCGVATSLLSLAGLGLRMFTERQRCGDAGSRAECGGAGRVR